MKVEFTINKKTGDVTTNILDRESENCSNIYRLTQKLGEQTEDVLTGPECDEVHEGEVG